MSKMFKEHRSYVFIVQVETREPKEKAKAKKPKDLNYPVHNTHFLSIFSLEFLYLTITAYRLCCQKSTRNWADVVDS